MSDIRQTYEIAAPADDVWRALTEAEIIRDWSSAEAVFPLRVGAQYSLWNGDIGGEILEIVPMEKLVQTWKPTDWVREDSVVTFLLTPLSDGTRVDLIHANVEDSDFAGTTEGWDIYYLGAVKRMLEERPAKTGAAKLAKAKPRITKPAKKGRNTKAAKGRNTRPAKVAKAAPPAPSAKGKTAKTVKAKKKAPARRR